MISVQNHQQRLSGSKLLLAVGFILTLGACSPKTTGVLRSPDHRGGNVGAVSQKEEKPEEKKTEETIYEAKKAEALRNSIALVLPFQLDRVSPSTLSKEDIDRSAVALDFYQGFQLGLDQLSKEGKSFTLRIIDSRDDEAQNSNIAKSEEVANAAIIVGPVYPKEIRTFGANLSNKNILQINPLAASRASDFNLPNLVSLTPSINVHTKAMATKVAKDCGANDVIIIYNTSDNDGRQFINGFSTELKRLKPNIQVRSVSNIEQMNEALVTTGKNLLVIGTTDKFQLRVFLNNLDSKMVENNYSFHIYGHPLWDRIDFSAYGNFASYSPVISVESHMKPTSSEAVAFKDLYYSLYGVNPSDHSYKGYDAARYFGSLLAKYGENYAKHITDETFDGLFSSYRFEYNSAYGYVNSLVSYKVYRGSSFQLN